MDSLQTDPVKELVIVHDLLTGDAFSVTFRPVNPNSAEYAQIVLTCEEEEDKENPPMATTTLQVAANSDDANEKSDGTVNLNSSTINATAIISGYRFTTVPIEPGSTVTAASLEFYLTGGTYAPDARIRAHAHDNAATFTTSTSNISGRSQTTAYTDWTDTDNGAGWYTTQDIAAVVQEIIDRGGWSKDNAIAFVLTRQGSGNMPIVDYNGNTSRAAKLNLTWTPPSTGANPKVGRIRITTKVGGILIQ